MQFDWNNDTIRWYLNANNYTGFYKDVAEAIKPRLTRFKSLADFGCGLALFDFEIAPYMETVDCYDLSDAALASVRERLGAAGIQNVTAHKRDAKRLSGKWDVIYMSFFGSRKPDVYLPMCKKLVAVVSMAVQAEMFPAAYQRYKKNTVDETVRYLDSKKLPYRLTQHELEFGQPFVSEDDARHFVRAYTSGITDGEVAEFLRRRLVRTGREDYPFYIPRTKSVGIFELDGKL